MTFAFVTTYPTRAAAGALAVGAAVLIGGASPAFAQGARSLEGVWALTLTLRNFATGAPLGAPPERSLLTFHQGGTMSGSAGSTAFAPGQRTDGHGTWAPAGPSTFSNRQVAIVAFTTPPNPPASPGFQAGWQLISSTYTLSDDNNLTVAATVEFFDVNRANYRSLCVAGLGERFR
jgi:hypothetical protein